MLGNHWSWSHFLKSTKYREKQNNSKLFFFLLKFLKSSLLEFSLSLSPPLSLQWKCIHSEAREANAFSKLQNRRFSSYNGRMNLKLWPLDLGIIQRRWWFGKDSRWSLQNYCLWGHRNEIIRKANSSLVGYVAIFHWMMMVIKCDSE